MHVRVHVCACAVVHACVCIHVVLEQRERAVEETQHQSKLLNECATKCKQLEEHSVRYRKQLAHARAEVGGYVLSKRWFLPTRSQC